MDPAIGENPAAAAAAAVPPPPPPPHQLQNVMPDRRVPLPPPAVLRALIFFGSLILLLYSISFVMWALLRPADPDIRLASATLSVVRFSGTVLTAECAVDILVINSDIRYSATFQHLELTLIFRPPHKVLSEYYPSPFSISGRNSSFISADLRIPGVDLGAEVAAAVKRGIREEDLKLTVEIKGVVRYSKGRWRTMVLRRRCAGLSFEFLTGNKDGFLLNPNFQCPPYLF